MCHCGVVNLGLTRKGRARATELELYVFNQDRWVHRYSICAFEFGVLFTSFNPQTKWHSVQVHHWVFPSPKGRKKYCHYRRRKFQPKLRPSPILLCSLFYSSELLALFLNNYAVNLKLKAGIKEIYYLTRRRKYIDIRPETSGKLAAPQ